jgi:hypothetical protein
MVDWDAQRMAELRARAAAYKAKQQERVRERTARQKHLRRTLNGRGFYDVLRQVAEGGDALGRKDQLRIVQMVERAVQDALQFQSSRLSSTKNEAKDKYRDSRLSKIEAVMLDPAATDGERTAAQEAFNKLNKGSAKRVRSEAIKAGYVTRGG